jgi:hypothetical protein
MSVRISSFQAPHPIGEQSDVPEREPAAQAAHNAAPLHRTLSEAVMNGQETRGPSYLRTVVDRVTQEGTEFLERMGLQPGREESLPTGQRFRLDEPTTRQWKSATQRIGRAAMAVVVVALLAAGLRMLSILSFPVWQIWKVAGIAAFIIGLLARHAELQLATQLRAYQVGGTMEDARTNAPEPRSDELSQRRGT